MTVYSVRFTDGDAGAGGPSLVYTVPSGNVAVIRSVTFVFGGTVGGQIQLLRGTGQIIVMKKDTGNGDSVEIDLRAVLNAGETLYVTVIGSGSVVWWNVSGYLLKD